MRYKSEMNFSDEFVRALGLDEVKRHAAIQVIKQLPVEHLDALFNFDITRHTDMVQDVPKYKHVLLAHLIKTRTNHIEAMIETTL